MKGTYKVLAALLVMGALLVPAARARPKEPKAAGAVTFGVPRIVDPIRLFSEPNIKIGPDGTIHASGPQGTGVQRSVWDISVDNGDSWRIVQALPDKQALGPNKASAGPGGGDTEITITRDGRAYYSDLWSLTCFTAATTTDNGANVDSNFDGCSSPPGDRQWMAAFDPTDEDETESPYEGPLPLVYQVYDDIVTGDRVDKTTDGLHYERAGQFADTGDQFVVNGNALVDQHTGDLLGLVGEETGQDDMFGLALAVGAPDKDGNPTFTYNTITHAIPGDPQTLFPVMAQDTARNVYVVWAVDCDGDPPEGDACYHVFYSWASAEDGWTTWSEPRQVDQPPSLTNVMPWIAAGGEGNVDIVWYGTTTRLSPSGHHGQAWDVYMAELSHANSGNPQAVQAKVTPHPMHYDDICLLGTGCIQNVGNRNLADFFQVTIDQEGRARVVYDDTSNNLIQANNPLDHSGGALVTVATQQTVRNAWTGKSLTSIESTAPISAIEDPAADALFPALGGDNVGAVDITGVGLSMGNGVLDVKVTTAGGTLADAAQAAGGTAAQLVVRWQVGNTLSYAAVEGDAGGGPLNFYAGDVRSIDLCSVSACKPNYFTYPAPPAGGTTVTGTATGVDGDGPVTYDILVPVTAVTGLGSGALLEEVMGFAAVVPTSARIPMTNAQAFADEVPLVLEGTRTFNFKL